MVLTGTHNLCFEQKYEKYQNFYLKTFSVLVVKFSIYLNRLIFVMINFLSDEFVQRELKAECDMLSWYSLKPVKDMVKTMGR